MGIEDGSGEWENTRAMIERFDGFDVFAGSEQFLLDTLHAGKEACISATANINPAAIHTFAPAGRARMRVRGRRR